MQDVLDGKYTIKEMVAQLSIREMAELCVGTERREEGSIVGSASYCVPGAAGDTSSVLKETRGVKNMILADGPAGLRLQRHFKTDKDGNILPGGEGFDGTYMPLKMCQKVLSIITNIARRYLSAGHWHNPGTRN